MYTKTNTKIWWMVETEKAERLTAESICEYRAKNPLNGHWYECKSFVLRHLSTKTLLRVRGYHQKICVGEHDGIRTDVELPNEAGICTGKRSYFI